MNEIFKTIKKHRERYPKALPVAKDKLLEELEELVQELKVPTTKSNLRKEIGDVIITLTGFTELSGMDIEEIILETIEINEKRDIRRFK